MIARDENKFGQKENSEMVKKSFEDSSNMSFYETKLRLPGHLKGGCGASTKFRRACTWFIADSGN